NICGCSPSMAQVTDVNERGGAKIKRGDISSRAPAIAGGFEARFDNATNVGVSSMIPQPLEYPPVHCNAGIRSYETGGMRAQYRPHRTEWPAGAIKNSLPSPPS